MQNNNARIISGVSIATTIIAGLSIMALVIAWLAIVVGGGVFNAFGPSLFDDGYSTYDRHGYHHGSTVDAADATIAYGRDYYLDDDEFIYLEDDYNDYDVVSTAIMGLGNLALFLGGVVVLFVITIVVVSLIGGILGIRNAKDPTKLGRVFGWNLAGAICCLLTGRMVTMTLQIIATVFAYRGKSAAQAFGAYPSGYVTVEGFGTPAPPVAPQAPAAPQPPAAPVAPAASAVPTTPSAPTAPQPPAPTQPPTVPPTTPQPPTAQ